MVMPEVVRELHATCLFSPNGRPIEELLEIEVQMRKTVATIKRSRENYAIRTRYQLLFQKPGKPRITNISSIERQLFLARLLLFVRPPLPVTTVRYAAETAIAPKRPTLQIVGTDCFAWWTLITDNIEQAFTWAIQIIILDPGSITEEPPIASAKADIESWQAITFFLISIQTHKEWRPCYRFQLPSKWDPNSTSDNHNYRK